MNWGAVLSIRIGQPVRAVRERRSQAYRVTQGDGWTCPRCRVSNVTQAELCKRCGSVRWSG